MARFFTGFLTALVGSVVANLIVLFVLGPAVTNPALPLHALSVMPVAMLTAIGVVGATIVYAILRAFMKNPNKVFFWISVVVLIVSFIPDYMIIGMKSGPFAGGDVASAATLALMHVVAAVVVVGALTKLWGPRMMKMMATTPIAA